MFRQGDVLIIPVNETIDSSFKKVEPDNRNRVILAEGEATGHAHAIQAVAATLWASQVVTLLQVHEQTKVLHEEHDSIDLDAGMYKIVRQREYSPEKIRYVAD